MVDIPLTPGSDEKSHVVTELLYCRRTFAESASPRPRKRDGTTHVECIDTDHVLRHASLRYWLLAELELQKYGAEHFAPYDLPTPETKVLRIGLGIYDDDFNAYRGVYHGIGGVYLGVLNLGWHERESLRNIHPIMFIPHAADRTAIYHELETDLRILEQQGIRVEIRGVHYQVFVKLLLQITDMPQGMVRVLLDRFAIVEYTDRR
jgi:hypothetical protein